ncbi:MAG: RNA polymerase subunit sigma-24, partial [Dehalococcoidia bacterium]|nr:RNA polymerase subunit sigma-24 [Dehalococcoidia bacterium]
NVPLDEAATLAAGDNPPGAHETTALLAALRELPPKQRQTIAYHYLAGMPYAEVACLLGGSAAAARRAAADGVARLRSMALKGELD